MPPKCPGGPARTPGPSAPSRRTGFAMPAKRLRSLSGADSLHAHGGRTLRAEPAHGMAGHIRPSGLVASLNGPDRQASHGIQQDPHGHAVVLVVLENPLADGRISFLHPAVIPLY